MSLSLVQSKKANNAGVPTTTVSATFNSTPTAGNLIHVSVSYYNFNNGITASVADNKGNTYTEIAGSVQQSTTHAQQISFYAKNISSSATFTVTVTVTTATYAIIHIYEVAGADTSSPKDQDGSTSTTSSTSIAQVTASGVNSQANEIVFVGIASSTSTTPTAGTGYNLGETDNSAGTTVITLSDAYKITSGIETSIGQINYSPVIAGFSGQVVTYKEASGSADLTVTKSDDLNAWNDSRSLIFGTLLSNGEQFTLSDSLSNRVSHLLNLADQLTITDNLNLLQSYLTNFGDQLSLTDQQSLVQGYLLSTFSDTLSFLDAISLLLETGELGRSFADTLVLSDELLKVLGTLLDKSDTLSFNDGVIVSLENFVSGLYNLEDILERIRQTIDNPVYYTEQDLNAATQDGYDEIIAATGSILKGTIIPFQEKLVYYDFRELIPDFVAVTAIYNPQTKRFLTPVSLRWLDTNREDWETQDGTPEYFSVVSHRYVAIYNRCVANYGNMYVYYKASAQALTEDSAIKFNGDFISALEEYAVADLHEQNQEFTKAGLRFKNYINLVQQLETWVKSGRESDRIPSLQIT